MLIGADLSRAVLVASPMWLQDVWQVYLIAGLVVGNTFVVPTIQAVMLP